MKVLDRVVEELYRQSTCSCSSTSVSYHGDSSQDEALEIHSEMLA